MGLGAHSVARYLQLSRLLLVLGVLYFTVLCVPSAAAPYQAPNYKDWRNRTIYQILTDRFSRAKDDELCTNFRRYCGGSFKGVERKVRWLKDLGVDAVWISPIIQQTDGMTWESPDGYHGFWPRDNYQLNLHFGSEKEVNRMLDTLHKNGIWGILDVVPNHVGYVPDFNRRFRTNQTMPDVTPFTKASHYHDCNGCLPGCKYDQWAEVQRVHCRLSDLPDLNYSNPEVMGHWMNWTQWVRQTFKFDAFRVDAALHVEQGLLQAIKSHDMNFFTFGEFALTAPYEKAVRWLAGTVQDGGLHSVLNFPQYHILREVFVYRHQPMSQLALVRWLNKDYFGQDIHYLVNFLGNHDNRRFMCERDDQAMFKNSLAFLMWIEGIPVMYYGDEQGMLGYRDPLWHLDWDKTHPMYIFTKMLIWYRQRYHIWDFEVDEVYIDWNYYVFARGDTILLVTRMGDNAWDMSNMPPNNQIILGLNETQRWSVLNDTSPPLLSPIPEEIVPSKINASWGINATWIQGIDTSKLEPSFAVPFELQMNESYTRNLSLMVPKRFWGKQLRNIFNMQEFLTVRYDGVAVINVSTVGEPQLFVLAETPGSYRNPDSFGRASFSSDRPVSPKRRDPLHSDTLALIVTSVLSIFLGLAIYIFLDPDWRDRFRRNGVVHTLKKQLRRFDSNRHVVKNPQGTLNAIKDSDAKKRGKKPPVSCAVHIKKGVDFLDSDKGGDVERALLDTNKSKLSPVMERAATEGTTRLRKSVEQRTPSSKAVSPLHPRLSIHVPHHNESVVADLVDVEQVASPFKRAAMERELQASGGFPSQTVSSPTGQPPTRSELNVSRLLGQSALSPDSASAEALTFSRSAPPGIMDTLARTVDSSGSFINPLSSPMSDILSNGSVAGLGVSQKLDFDEMVLHVAMEYSIPHLGYESNLMFGGLGKVVDIFIRAWPGRMGVCAPLYSNQYADENATEPIFASQCQPPISFNVTIMRRHINVQLYVLHDNERNVTYYLLQADIFRHRHRPTIYSFENEEEMLSWISIFSQAVAVVIYQYRIKRVQFHDYHGALALCYLPADVETLPQVLFVAHNAHYNGVFVVPDRHRRQYVYSTFDLDAGHLRRTLEHKGAVDIIHSVITYIKKHQGGFGVVAVSDRYAEQIRNKLSVFWQLPSKMIIGITNALFPGESLAKQFNEDKKVTLEEVMEKKKEAKLELQKQLGLNVGAEYDLLVYMGRMTHQKGVDVIAVSAKTFMKHHPNIQLIVVGPVGDTTGAEATHLMQDVANMFPGRVYSPPNKYMAGREKDLLILASDFCLCPSRFEPCGLVDIEFGWNGALIIGNNTGGLNKMPGVYYEAESTALKHYEAKLTRAVDKAMRMTPEKRLEQMEAALRCQFSVGQMMQRYVAAWDMAHKMYLESLTELDQSNEATRTRHTFFDQRWRQVHVKDPDKLKDKNGDHVRADGKMGPVLKLPFIETKIPMFMASNFLLLVLQSFTNVPGLILLAYIMYIRISLLSRSGCPRLWDQSYTSFAGVIPDLAAYVIRMAIWFLFYGLASPVWTRLVFKLRPLTYIRLTILSTWIALLLVALAVKYTPLIIILLPITASLAPSGGPLIALGMLGEDDEVSEVGIGHMAFAEFWRGAFAVSAVVLALIPYTLLPFLVTSLTSMFVVACGLAWFCSPYALKDEFRHLKLQSGGTLELVAKKVSFWLTIAVQAIDSVGICLVGYATLFVWDLNVFLRLLGVTYGTMMVGVVLTALVIRLRFFQLYIRATTFFFAALPLYTLLRMVVVFKIGNVTNMLVAVGAIELFFSPRSPILGVMAFQTIPTREAVATWQVLVTIAGCSTGFILSMVGYAATKSTTGAFQPSKTDLLVASAILETLRFLIMGVVARVMKKEDLAAM